MNQETLTDKIFKVSCPYNHGDQGQDPRLLFVCSAGLLRSATGANLYAKKGYNTRNCGTHEYALISLSANLIAWADHIIFVQGENYTTAQRIFKNSQSQEDLTVKAIILDIPDDYTYNSPYLISLFEWQLKNRDLSRPKEIILPNGAGRQ